MGKVEEDLEKSRIAREKQCKEFTKQIESEKNRHEKLVSMKGRVFFDRFQHVM